MSWKEEHVRSTHTPHTLPSKGLVTSQTPLLTPHLQACWDNMPHIGDNRTTSLGCSFTLSCTVEAGATAVQGQPIVCRIRRFGSNCECLGTFNRGVDCCLQAAYLSLSLSLSLKQTKPSLGGIYTLYTKRGVDKWQ